MRTSFTLSDPVGVKFEADLADVCIRHFAAKTACVGKKRRDFVIESGTDRDKFEGVDVEIYGVGIDFTYFFSGKDHMEVLPGLLISSLESELAIPTTGTPSSRLQCWSSVSTLRHPTSETGWQTSSMISRKTSRKSSIWPRMLTGVGWIYIQSTNKRAHQVTSLRGGDLRQKGGR